MAINQKKTFWYQSENVSFSARHQSDAFDRKGTPIETAHYHLPGLFEFYEFYSIFLPLFFEHREYFYDWCDIGSIYGAPADCLWGGGRTSFDGTDVYPEEVLSLMRKYEISARLTFSNSLLQLEHLSDRKCNSLCEIFENNAKIVCIGENSDAKADADQNRAEKANAEKNIAMEACTVKKNMVENGVIIYSDLLMDYIKNRYPKLYFISSTTKVISDFNLFVQEVDREEFRFVVPDFRLNRKLKQLNRLSDVQKEKVEFLCNECCSFGCNDRKACYESVSHKVLGDDCPDHICVSPDAAEGYVFSKAMKNPGFIGVEDIRKVYLPMGFTNFKIEGRNLGSALVLEFLLYYMTKPEYQLRVREKIYLNHSLDLF